ncbi:MAG: hypothetical protein MUF07_13075 [Steroidobacteraceae bacterium]|jgi:hypothetical protein|nr:hypothetical protein [Steroidobacteraceae bacterium]
MAKVNYRLQKRQREEARKKVQLEKQAKRGRVPDAPDATGTADTPAVEPDSPPDAATPPAAR